MNFLFHLYLAGDDPVLLAGGLAGDFVKGPLAAPSAGIAPGIELHRRIDSFAHSQESFGESRRRISPHYGLYRGVLVDLFYDHFLSVSWQEWREEPLPHYLARVRRVVERQWQFLPERLRELLPIIFEDLIPSYQTPEGIGSALTRMSRRVRRPNPLAGAEEELLQHYDALQDDFRIFLPRAAEYAARYGAPKEEG